MRKNLKYVGLIVAGLLLGLGVVWLIGRFAASPNSSRSASIATPNLNAAVAPAVSPTRTPLPYQNTGLTRAPAIPDKPSAPAAIGGEYIALGDSVAYGIGAPDPTNQGYAGLFYTNYLKRVQPDLLAYCNLAVPGETTASFLSKPNAKSQLQNFKDEIASAARSGLRVSPVSLTIGGNDLLNVEGKSDADRQAALNKFDTNFSRILDEIRGQIGQADLLVTTYYNPLAYNTGGNDTDSDWFRRFDAVIRQRAGEKGAKLVDFTAPVVGKEKELTWIASNDVHPTPAGHIVLAQAVWKAAGYDTVPPGLTLTYSPIPANNTVTSNSRLVFKVAAVDDWASAVTNKDADVSGAGKLSGAWVTLDDGARLALGVVPGRYSPVTGGGQEYSYVLDTTQLTPGKHTLKFEAADTAGNTASLEIGFTQQ